MNENIEKAETMAGQAKIGVIIDRWCNIFHALRNTLVENWQSGIAGKVFLVVSALILAWLVFPLFSGEESISSAESAGRGGATPTIVLNHYYQAYFDGDLNGYLGCLDCVREQDQDTASEIADNFNHDDWRERVRTRYGTVSYGVPKWSGDGKMDIKVELENREDGGSSIKEWCLVNVNGTWLVDTERTTNPFEMGL